MATPPKRADSQTPAEYMRELREWAREHKLCTNCITRKPRVVRGKDKHGQPKKRPETCDYCLKQKAEARKRREASVIAVDPNTGEMELNPRTGKPYATCSQCRSTSTARRDAA